MISTTTWASTNYNDTTDASTGGWITIWPCRSGTTHMEDVSFDLEAEKIVALRAKERARSQRVQASLQPAVIREQRRGRDPHVPMKWLQRKHS